MEYTGGGYTIDRWMQGVNVTSTLTKQGILLQNHSEVSGSGVGFHELLEAGLFQEIKGRTVTFSVLEANGTLSSRTCTLPNEVPTDASVRVVSFPTSFGTAQLSVTK